jgi:hypothetical protein
LSSSPVMISLALASSGCCNSLYLNSFELEARVGIERYLYRLLTSIP